MSVHEGGGASRSTEAAHGTSAATDVSLREYLSAQIENSRKECQEGITHMETRLTASIAHLEETFTTEKHSADERIATALTAIDHRFESVNEFRQSLGDLGKTMATQSMLTSLQEKHELLIATLTERYDAQYVALREDMQQTRIRVSKMETLKEGAKLTMSQIVSYIALAVVILGLVVAAANYFASPGG